MYKQGEVKLTIPMCEAGEDCEEQYYDDDHKHKIGNETERAIGAGVAFLPHSCDEWVIGSSEQIKDLINDLMRTLSPSDRISVINQWHVE
jgi:adenosine/AMP kinase